MHNYLKLLIKTMKDNRMELFLFVLVYAIYLLSIFYYFPLMGHDFTLVLQWNLDYHHAWTKFGVFSPTFTAQRCLGMPVWNNPLTSTYSLFHLLSVLFTGIPMVCLFILIYLILGFLGIRKFLSMFEIDIRWKNYFLFGWLIQGYAITHAIVGHVGYMSIIVWPLIAYFLLKKITSKKEYILSMIAASLLFTHEFYGGNAYYFFMFPLSFCFVYVLLKAFDKAPPLKETILRLILICIASSILIIPRLMAVTQMTKNFQRTSSFYDAGLMKGLEYSIMSQIFPLPLDYNKMMSWNYGNWESINYLFPGFLLCIFIFSILNFRKNRDLFISLCILILTGAVVASGVYADVVKLLPVIKMFHVNPRWMALIIMPSLVLCIFSAQRINFRPVYYGLYIFLVLPLYLAHDPSYLALNYNYGTGVDIKNNKVYFCYEPVFGHNMELFPKDKAIEGKYLDPRCYLGNTKCNNFVLPDDLVDDLESYKLEAFKN